MEHGILGQNGTVGQNGTGPNVTIPSYPKCVSFCRNAWAVLPHAHSTNENASDERGETVLGRGS